MKTGLAAVGWPSQASSNCLTDAVADAFTTRAIGASIGRVGAIGKLVQR